VLASGGDRLPALNVAEFMGQRAASGGFWMSFHEITNDYPWLCKRLARVSEHHGVAIEPNPRRSVGAWILALFVPRIGIPGLGGVGALVGIAMIGVLAAIAIPAYQDYTLRAKVVEALNHLERVRAATAPYVTQNGAYPDSLSQVGVPAEAIDSNFGSIALTEEGIELTLRSDAPALDGETLVYGAYRAEGGQIDWSCAGGTLPAKYRPVKCRE
jgi:Tfp pilus assembly major pilin PilA